MGNDGGRYVYLGSLHALVLTQVSIPKRRELVREAARQQTASEAKESQQEQLEHQWSTCLISQELLKAPVVSDFMGFLYNKSAVLEYLLPSDDPSTEQFKADQKKLLGDRITALRDVVELHFETDGQGDAKAEEGRAGSRWVCPVSNKELGPAVKASYIVPCGHVFADVALKTVSDYKCLECNEPYETENVISVLSTNTSDQDRLRQRRVALQDRGLAHSLKKISSKKRKAAAADKEREALKAGAVNGADAKVTEGSGAAGAKASIKNAGTAALTAKVLAEEEAKAKRRKANPNDNLKGLFSITSSKPIKNGGDFMTRGFDIPATAKQ